MCNEQAIQAINKKYEEIISIANENFNLWIETGDDQYKQEEMTHTAIAFGLLKAINIITT